MKVLPKGASEKGLEKAAKRSELLKRTREKRVGLAESLRDAPLEDYEQTILALSERRSKNS